MINENLTLRSSRSAFAAQWTNGSRNWLCLLGASLLYVAQIQAATLTWTGGSLTSANWSDSANWGGVGTPANGDTLFFSGGVSRLTNTNNINALIVSAIHFAGASGGYQIYGNAFFLTNRIDATNTAGLNIINNNITLSNATILVTVSNSPVLTLAGSISGNVGLTKLGTGTLNLDTPSGFNSFSGTTWVQAGVLTLFNGGPADGGIGGPLVIGTGSGTATVRLLLGDEIPNAVPITINAGGTLDLNGWTETVGPITLVGGAITTGTGLLTILSDMTVSASPSTANISGRVEFTSGLRTITVDNGTAFHNIDIPANLSDTGSGLNIVNGPTPGAWLALQGSNSFTGPLTISNLTVSAETPYALGATSGGTTVQNGGRLFVYNTGFTNESVTLNAGATLESQLNVTWTGPVILNGNATISAYDAGNLFDIQGPISGTGNLTLSSAGTAIQFSGSQANTYAGTTTVNAGTTLLLNKAASDGAIPQDLNINGTVRNLRDYQISNSSTVTIGAAGLLDLSGIIATNTILASPVANQTNTGSWTLGYAFTPSTNITVTHVRSYFGTKVSIWTDTGTLLASQSVSSVPATWVETPLSTPIQLTAGSHYRVAAYTGGGTFYWRTDLGGTFPYGTIDQSYEITGDAFPTNIDAPRWWFVDLRYTVVLPSGGDGIGSLNGSGSVNLGANYIDSFGTGSHTYNGLIYGSGDFDVAASGITYTLNGNNTYSGLTRIYDGYTSTVKINGSQPQSPVYVGTHATLGGSGTVGIITNNGTVAPGNSPGVLTSSNVTFSSSASFTVELDGPTAGIGYDQLNVRGTVSLANATLNVLPLFSSTAHIGDQFTILNNDLADAVMGTFSGLPEGSTFSANGYKFTISYAGGTGNDVVLTVADVPGAQAGSSVTAGNGSHSISPNECNGLFITISNKTASAMTAVSATLTSADPNVIVTQPNSAYPTVPASGTSTNSTPFQISTLPSFACGSNIVLNLSVTDASHGAFNIPVYLTTGGPSASPTRYDMTGNVSIPDVGTVESTNVVSGFSGPLEKVTVSLYLTHQYDSDLTNISLIAPDGTTVLLSSANGGSGQNYGSSCSPDASRTTFDDAAGTAITSGSAPFAGTYKPQGTLASFIGTAANGNWRLHIQDGFGGSLGTLRCWSLFLYPVTCATGGGACALCANNFTVTNTLTTSSDVQVGRLSRDCAASTCGSPKPCPGTVDSTLRPYHAYSFYNGYSNACVTVSLTAPLCGVYSAAYLGSFDPANLCANYLGDAGDDTLDGNACGLGIGTRTYSINVPANSVFIVTVNQIFPALCGVPYTLGVSGGDCRPILSATQSPGSTVSLSWPTVAGGYQLEATPALVPASWAPITNEPVASNNRFAVTNSTVSPADRSYRLHKP